MITPTARSLALLRSEGWRADVVERRITPRICRDLFGCLDILALRAGEVLAVQVTSASNLSARVRKVTEADALGDMREAGWQIEVHGWRKAANGRWTCKRVDLS